DNFELVEKIVKDVLRKLNNPCLPKDIKGVVGFEQEMGRGIISQKSIKNPENHSHLWGFGDNCDVLENSK
ncbi:hypothetical protein S245_029762, partial [Arachis hypogaea]